MSVRHGSWDSFPQYIRWRCAPASYVREQATQHVHRPVEASQRHPVTAVAGGQDSGQGDPSANERGKRLGHLMGRLLHLITR